MGDKSKTLVKNRKALHEYDILTKYEAGISLTGNEPKRFADGRVSLAGAHVRIVNGEAFLVGATIGTADDTPSTRPIKLLLNRHEIDKIDDAVVKSGLTVVPLEAYYLKGHRRMKLEIAVAKGRKSHDKRRALKEKAFRREARDGRDC